MLMEMEMGAAALSPFPVQQARGSAARPSSWSGQSTQPLPWRKRIGEWARRGPGPALSRALTRVLAIALATGASCRTPPPPAPQPITPLPAALAAPVPASSGPLLRYEVRANALASELQVEALFPPGTPAEFAVERGYDRYLREVQIADGDLFQPMLRRGAVWRADSCPERGCRVRYRYLLAKAARAVDDVDEAMAHSGSYLATPPLWLLRPTQDFDEARARLHVSVPPGLRFVTGLFPAPGGSPDTYEADLWHLDAAPYSAFGPLRTLSADVQGGRLEVAIPPGFQRSEEELLAWATRSAQVVGTYFAGFPVPRLALFLLPTRGAEIGLGTTMGHGGAAIVVFVGREIAPADLLDDWVLPHEMIHLAMSPLRIRHRWLKEGIATYVEPIARARAGHIPVERVWDRFLESMKEGLPGWGDQGLDNTPTWGRLYWGGALFCLLADVEIRERTGNRKSLDDAFRAIVKAGGNIAVSWEIDQVLREGDRGIGLPILSELYARMANQPVPVDLDGLWRRLGISRQGDTVRFHDDAPLAGIRRAITAPQ